MNGFELYERFCSLLESKGMTKADFCKKTGVRQGALSNWATRGTMPSADLAITISNALNVSTDYVLGKTDILNYDSNVGFSLDELSMIDDFKNLDKESQRQLVLMLAFLKDQQNKK